MSVNTVTLLFGIMSIALAAIGTLVAYMQLRHATSHTDYEAFDLSDQQTSASDATPGADV